MQGIEEPHVPKHRLERRESKSILATPSSSPVASPGVGEIRRNSEAMMGDAVIKKRRSVVFLEEVVVADCLAAIDYTRC